MIPSAITLYKNLHLLSCSNTPIQNTIKDVILRMLKVIAVFKLTLRFINQIVNGKHSFSTSIDSEIMKSQI